MTVKKLCYLVAFTTILFVQEEVLTIIPSVQFTFLLILLYGATIGIGYGSIVVVAHVLLDNLYMASFTIFTIGPMIIGYEVTLIVGYLLRNKSEWILATASIFCALLYAGLFIPINIYVYDVDLLAYVIADIPFDLVMVSCNFITVLFLFKPLKRVIEDSFRNRYDLRLDDRG